MLSRILIAALCLPVVLSAQATVAVPVQEPVYADLDRLFDAGIVRKMLVGQRPYSRREIARIILDASTPPARYPISPANQRLIERLSREYATDIAALRGDTTLSRRVELNAARLDVLGTNSPYRAIPPDSLGSVAADINPLLNDRAGRIWRVGTNAAAEAELTWRPARSLVLDARPRVVGGMNAGDAFAIGELQALDAKVLAKDIALSVGRQQVVLGVSPLGGLAASSSSRPLDMVKLSNDTPLVAPSFLRVLGPLRGTVYLADLGPNQTFPHSKVFAYQLAGNPFTWRLEASATVLAEFGGNGAPTASFRNRIIDLVPILQYTLSNKSRDQISNKLSGADFSVRIPELRGSRIYVEAVLDDADPRRWGSTFWNDAGYIGGWSVANLGLDGALSGRFEYHHTGLRYYEHTPWRSGIAFNRVLLGDPLGNEGDGGYLNVAWDGGGASSFQLDGAIERRYGNLLGTQVSNANQDDFHFITLQGFPPEWRHRVAASWVTRRGVTWRGTVQAGYERVRDFAFVSGASRNNFLLSAAVEYLHW